MSPFAKRAMWLLIAQIVCVGVGLWTHHHWLLRTATDESADAAWRPMLVTGVTSLWLCALLALGGWVIVRRMHDESEAQRQRSVSELMHQARSLVRARDAVIFGLARLADSRDEQTGEHLDRISAYATTLAAAARRDARYESEISPAFVQLIGSSSVLHDIGKVGIRDSILRKAGPLTEEERREMESHTRLGADCLEEIERRLGSSNFLRMARDIARHHHERWDGGGYPDGLRGTQIPLAARIVAIADVYDALASRRPYKRAFTHEECVKIIRDLSGLQFEPALVEVWLTVGGKYRDIARHFGLNTEGSAVPEAAESDRDPGGGTLGDVDGHERDLESLVALR